MEVINNSFQFKDLFDKARKILILMGGDSSVDLTSAGLAINSVLKSHGKTTRLVSVNKLSEAAAVLSGADEIENELESSNLVLSLDYTKNPIKKISYKIEGKTLNLILKPQKNINPEEVQTSFTGGDYNLIIVLGTQSLGDLDIYTQHKDLFESLPTINIDINPSNTRFGKLNIVDDKIGSVCGLLSLLFNEAELKLPEKTANLLLLGIREATNNFTNIKGSRIFEAAAYTSKLQDEKEIKETVESTEIDKDLPKDWLSPKVYRSSKVS